MKVESIVTGSCMGTGAAINVCLGFKPSMVILFNLNSTNIETILWIDQMQASTDMDEGLQISGTSSPARAAVTANGISLYDGGDEITYDGTTDNRWEDSAGDSAEEVYVDGLWNRDASGDAEYQCIGDRLAPSKENGQKIKTPSGFTIGTGIQTNDKRLSWLAIS